MLPQTNHSFPLDSSSETQLSFFGTPENTAGTSDKYSTPASKQKQQEIQHRKEPEGYHFSPDAIQVWRLRVAGQPGLQATVWGLPVHVPRSHKEPATQKQLNCQKIQ